MKKEAYGEFGGRVIRKFKGEGGASFIPGATLTPEMVEGWPINNRRALHMTGKVEWFTRPMAEEKPVKVPEKQPEKAPVRTTGRTKHKEAPPAKRTTRRTK